MITTSQLRKFCALIYKGNISLDLRGVTAIAGVAARLWITSFDRTKRYGRPPSADEGEGLHRLDEPRNANDIVNNSARLKLCPPGNYRKAHDIRAWE